MMQELDALLGDSPRRFHDWQDENGQFASRLTITSPDGVENVYQASAGRHDLARRRVCTTAYESIQRSMASVAVAPVPGAGYAPFSYAPPGGPYPVPPQGLQGLAAEQLRYSGTPVQQFPSYPNPSPGTIGPQGPGLRGDQQQPMGNFSSSPVSSLPPHVYPMPPPAASVPMISRFDDARPPQFARTPPYAVAPLPTPPPVAPPAYLRVAGGGPAGHIPYTGTNEGLSQFGPGAPNIASDVALRTSSQNPPYGNGATPRFASPIAQMAAGQTISRQAAQPNHSHSYQRQELYRDRHVNPRSSGYGSNKGKSHAADSRARLHSGMVTKRERSSDGWSRAVMPRAAAIALGRNGNVGMQQSTPVSSKSKGPLNIPTAPSGLKTTPSSIGLSGPDGDDVDDEDYLSQLNILWQRKVVTAAPVFTYERHDGQSKAEAALWGCTVKISINPPGSEKVQKVTRSLIARSKKDARKKAAKVVLADLAEINPAVTKLGEPDGKSAASPAANSEMADMPSGAGTATSILNQLWQKEYFKSRPEFNTEAAGGPSGVGRWRCDLVIRTKEFGVVAVFHISTQKKMAKQMSAWKGVEKLRELKMPGIDEVNVHSKPDVTGEVHRGIDITDPALANTEEMVRGSDDEGDDKLDDVPLKTGDLFGSRLKLPVGFDLTVASSPAKCDEWIEKYCPEGTVLGVYLDSKSARRLFAAFAKCAGVSIEEHIMDEPRLRVICLSAMNRGLLLRAALLEKDATGFERSSWVPSSVLRLLERQGVHKHGVLLDEGKLVLATMHGARCQAMHDVSVSSFALSGLAAAKRRTILAPLGVLVTHWLQQDFNPFSPGCYQSCAEVLSTSSDMEEGDAQLSGPCLLAAYACMCIQERIAHVASTKRLQLYGNVTEFEELSDRLMSRTPIAR